jgi:hypothetical protein
MNTVRQPATEAIRPPTTRAASTPIISPLMTVPTARPRSLSAASVAVIGTMICATTVVVPTTASAAASTAMSGAAAAPIRPADATTSILVISRRRSSRSPSGTSKASPTV